MHAPGRGKGAQGPWPHPLRPRGRAVRRRRAPPALERQAGLKDPRRPASLMHAYIVVSLMAGVRPRGSPGDRVGGGCRPGRQSSVGRGAARGSGRRRYEDPEVPPRAETRADGRRGAQGVAGGPGAAEREAAGSHWQDTGRVFTTATGTPLGARPIRKMFQDVCERAGLGRDWAPRDLRHTFVSLLSDDGMAIEKIARLVAMPAAMSPRPSLLGVAAVIIACRANRRDLPAIVRAWRMGPHDDDPENPPRDDDGDDDSGKNPPSPPEP